MHMNTIYVHVLKDSKIKHGFSAMHITFIQQSSIYFMYIHFFPSNKALQSKNEHVSADFEKEEEN